MTGGTRRLRLDRVASAARHAGIDRDVIVAEEIVSRPGYVIAARILNDKSVYNVLEDPSGRMVPLRAGHLVAGVLGNRQALRGYAGEVPSRLAVGDRVNVLNLGGVLGRCTAISPDLGPPFEAEVLGAVLSFPPLGDRVGRPARVADGAPAAPSDLHCRAPLVLVAGTSMDSGKTVAAGELVHGLTAAGFRVAAAKLTGVALRRDALAMLDAGAVMALTFDDAGVVSTDDRAALPAARAVLTHLDREARPDVIVAELGDGLLGAYGVGTILGAPDIRALVRALVTCAPDPVAAWGADRLLREAWGLRPTVVTGPATDNAVGRDAIRARLGVPAWNARRQPGELVAAVREALDG